MGKADGLSRRSDWEKGGEGDNKERTLLKLEWMKSIRAGEVIVEGIDILERIRKSEAKNDKVIKVVEEMKKAGVKMLRDEECVRTQRIGRYEATALTPRLMVKRTQ